MEDLATWIARAIYYEQQQHDVELDQQLVETMERLRGIDGTSTGREG